MRQNWLEWVVLTISVLAVVGIVGYLVVDGLNDDGRPPDPIVSLRHEAAYAGEQGWYLPATVSNRGDSAAEAVIIRATATVAGEATESEATIDYLPAGSDVEITFAFADEPEDDVSVQPIGFRLP